jgi:hypothetical protein
MRRWRWLGVLVAAALVMMSLAAAAASETWTKTFEGPGYGALFGVTLAPNGEILAVGATNHRHVAPYSGDVLLMRLTLDGTVVWERAWGGSGYEQAWAVAPAEDGGFLVFGETDSYGAGDRDFFLLKIADDGTQEWVRTYGRAHREWPYGMLPLADGDLLLYGFTTADNGARQRYALRTTVSGDVLWEYIAGDAREEFVLDAIETSEGNLVLCLCIDEDGGLVKLDAEGNVSWSKRFELPGWQFPSCIASVEDDGFLLAGFWLSETPRRQADAWLVRCSAEGEVLWDTAFGDPASDDYAQSILPLADGTCLIGELGNGMPLSLVDEEGNVLWRRLLAGSRVYAAEDLLPLQDGGFVIPGFIQITNGRSYDAILVRTDAEGRVSD